MRTTDTFFILYCWLIRVLGELATTLNNEYSEHIQGGGGGSASW